MLAMNLKTPRGARLPALSLTTIASNRASTGCSYKVTCGHFSTKARSIR
jgi:hypothetical protein